MQDELNLYLREYKAIVSFLLKDENKLKKGDNLFIKKEKLFELLNKNAYETDINKLKIWKGLGWIKTDEDRLTVRVTDPVTRKQAPYIKINLTVYRTLKGLE